MSDEMGIIAGKYETIERKGTEKDLKRIKEIIEKEKVEKIVVGYPRNMDGTLGNTARMVEAFVEELKRLNDIPIEMWDERLSSVSAERILIKGDVRRKKRKKVIDQISAVIILQNYLDSRNRMI